MPSELTSGSFLIFRVRHDALGVSEGDRSDVNDERARGRHALRDGSVERDEPDVALGQETLQPAGVIDDRERPDARFAP